MKKLDRYKRERLIRLQKKRERRRKKREKAFFRIRNENSGMDELHAPEVFTIQDKSHRKSLLKFLDRMRKKVMVYHRSVKINFSKTERMIASGTLLFYAELFRLNRIKAKGIKIKATPPQNKKVSEVLKQVGIYDIVGSPKKSITPLSEDVVYWRKATGNSVEGKEYVEILGPYDGIIPKELDTKLYIGITEAMANCNHHAYIGIREDGLHFQKDDKRWWMFSQKKDGRLSVVFCDLGMGIPKTLPNTKPQFWKRMLDSLGANPDDGMIIKEAIEESKSRTGDSYRGKGLTQLVQFIRNQNKSDASQVTIFSNNGAVQINSSQDGKKDTIINYGESILGTLIQWNMPIREEHEPNN